MDRIKKILRLIPLFFLISCLNEEAEVKIPDDILIKKKMALLLADIHLAQAECQTKNITKTDSTGKVQGIDYERIFHKHKTTKDQYKKSLSFYTEHPDLFSVVYEEVINELSRRQGELKKTSPPSPIE
jgi:hypothetical protein